MEKEKVASMVKATLCGSWKKDEPFDFRRSRRRQARLELDILIYGDEKECGQNQGPRRVKRKDRCIDARPKRGSHERDRGKDDGPSSVDTEAEDSNDEAKVKGALGRVASVRGGLRVAGTSV